MSKRILIITGDGGESYETLYAVHRFQEAGYEARIAAPSKRRLNLVMHDFEPGWDTYKESPGYVLESDLTFDEVAVRGLRGGGVHRRPRAGVPAQRSPRARDPAGVRRAREVDLHDLPRRPAHRRGRPAQGQARDLLRARPQRGRGVRRAVRRQRQRARRTHSCRPPPGASIPSSTGKCSPVCSSRSLREVPRGSARFRGVPQGSVHRVLQGSATGRFTGFGSPSWNPEP